MARTPAQRAASRRNLEKARAARKKDLTFQMGKSGLVPLGMVNRRLKVRKVIGENTSLVRSFGRPKVSGDAKNLKTKYEKFLRGSRVK